MKVVKFLLCVKFALICPAMAMAHVSEGGFVLLLPTEAYVSAGVAAVALTVLVAVAAPDRWVTGVFSSHALELAEWSKAQSVVSLISFIGMLFLIYLGLNGPRDPLSNLMPLSFWTLGWVALVSLSGVFGNLWAWLNPWTGLYRLIAPTPVLCWPAQMGLGPATLVLLGFASFLLADLAPDDPARLAYAVAGYWFANMVGLILFGPAWLHSVELGHVTIALYARLSALRAATNGGVGGPGWQIVNGVQTPFVGLFTLILLGVGSFDGLNETFWWLAKIGVNPLEFPGRSAVVSETLSGLALANIGLLVVFGTTVALGRILRPESPGFGATFNGLALSLLPIALAYHIAHYLPSFLVAIQYTVAALSDPFARGADLLGIEPFRVTTGFFNRIESVRIIWLSQAGVVVLGHVWSVLLSHAIAVRLLEGRSGAVRLTLPLSLFMVAYTFLGLWLLAAPRGA